MKKYLKAFDYAVFFLCCLLFTTNTARAITIKNKQYPLPPYQVSGMINNQGVVLDGMAEIRAQKHALWYGSAQFEPLYRGCGSLFSAGGGYRLVWNPLWIIGARLHLEGGRLPQGLGYYTKLNPGFEAHTMKGNVSCNFYLPLIVSSDMSKDKNKLTRYDYTGHTQRRALYLDQNHLSGDIAGDFNVLQYVKWGVGLYGAKQTHNASIIGAMTRLEYIWNETFSFHAKYSFDNFHRHSFTVGVRARKNSAPHQTSQLNQLLWRPIDRHVAPIQMLHRKVMEPNTHHLFFDSTAAEGNEAYATYENPSPRLNNAILKELRDTVPEDIEKIILHVSGLFDFADRKDAALNLEPFEHIRGEICKEGQLCIRRDCAEDELCKSNYCKYFEMGPQVISLEAAGLSLNKQEAGIPIVNANHCGTMQSKLHKGLNILAQNEHMLDGRPILRGAISMCDGTSVEDIAIVPAPFDKQYNVHCVDITGKKEANLQSHAITVQKQANGSPTQQIMIENVVISGWPTHEKPNQYKIGIELNNCASPNINSVWINHTEIAMLFDCVHTENSALRDIYIGSPHLTVGEGRLEKVRQSLAAITNASNAYQAHQALHSALSTREVPIQAILERFEHVDSEEFPESIEFTNLPIENAVTTGITTKVDEKADKSAKPSATKNIRNFATSSKGVWQKLQDWIPFKRNQAASSKPLQTKNAQGGYENSILEISDGLIMAQMMSVIVGNNSTVNLKKCTLGSQYLGALVFNDSCLNLVGRSAKDSFVYVDGFKAPFIPRSNPKWGTEYPNAFEIKAVEGTAKNEAMPENLSVVNTDVVLALPNTHHLLTFERDTELKRECCLGSVENKLRIDNTVKCITIAEAFSHANARELPGEAARSRSGGNAEVVSGQKGGDKMPIPQYEKAQRQRILGKISPLYRQPGNLLPDKPSENLLRPVPPMLGRPEKPLAPTRQRSGSANIPPQNMYKHDGYGHARNASTPLKMGGNTSMPNDPAAHDTPANDGKAAQRETLFKIYEGYSNGFDPEEKTVPSKSGKHNEERVAQPHSTGRDVVANDNRVNVQANQIQPNYLAHTRNASAPNPTVRGDDPSLEGLNNQSPPAMQRRRGDTSLSDNTHGSKFQGLPSRDPSNDLGASSLYQRRKPSGLPLKVSPDEMHPTHFVKEDASQASRERSADVRLSSTDLQPDVAIKVASYNTKPKPFIKGRIPLRVEGRVIERGPPPVSRPLKPIDTSVSSIRPPKSPGVSPGGVRKRPSSGSRLRSSPQTVSGSRTGTPLGKGTLPRKPQESNVVPPPPPRSSAREKPAQNVNPPPDSLPPFPMPQEPTPPRIMKPDEEQPQIPPQYRKKVGPSPYDTRVGHLPPRTNNTTEYKVPIEKILTKMKSCNNDYSALTREEKKIFLEFKKAQRDTQNLGFPNLQIRSEDETPPPIPSIPPIPQQYAAYINQNKKHNND